MKKELIFLELLLLVCALFACQSGETDDKTLASTHPKLEKQLERGDSIPTPISSDDRPDLYQRYRITLDKFETSGDYQVPERFSGELAPLDEYSHPDAPRFKTALQNGMAGGVNFAGKYTVVTTGCGTACQQHFIVDRETGKVTDKIQSELGARFRVNSRTFIINPPDEALGYENCSSCTPKTYVLENGKLRQVATEE